MSAILVIAHAPLASALKACATHVWPVCPASLEAYDVPADADVQATTDAIQVIVSRQLSEDNSAELMILTDVYGATPSNIAQKFSAPNVRVLTGVNLPMLMRSICYAAEPLEQLTQRALAGATQGIMSLAYTAPQHQTLKPSNDSTGHHHQQ